MRTIRLVPVACQGRLQGAIPTSLRDRIWDTLYDYLGNRLQLPLHTLLELEEEEGEDT